MEITLPIPVLPNIQSINPVGRPRVWDRQELKREMEQYIDKTPIPFLAEFAYQYGIIRQTLYKMEELGDTIKLLHEKMEAAVFRATTLGLMPTSLGIFTLKNLGWSDIDGKDLPQDQPILLPEETFDEAIEEKLDKEMEQIEATVSNDD